MTDFGTDIACMRDADSLFTSTSGVALVRQDAFHRITTDSVLGVGGDDWGFDSRRLLGANTTTLKARQMTLAAVIQRDPRVLTADVIITATSTNGIADVAIVANCTTAEGPFDIIVPSVRALDAILAQVTSK